MKSMTGETIFVDSSVFIAFFIDGIHVFEKLKKYRLVTSVNVIEEVTYILMKERAKEMTGIERHYDLLTHLRENPDLTAEISKEVISDVSNVLDFLDIVVLPLHSRWNFIEIYKPLC